VFATAEFRAFASQVVLFLHVSSALPDEPRPDLLAEVGGNQFPTVAYLAADGRPLQVVGHVTPLVQLATTLAELRAWQALRREVEAGAGLEAQRTLCRRELQMQYGSFAELAERVRRLEFPPAEQPALQQQLIDLQFVELLRQTKPAAMAAGGALFLPMFRAGRLPRAKAETTFWQYLFAYAAAQRDVDLFAELLASVQRHKAGDPRLARYVGALEQQLAALRLTRCR
jgi:hypothetical protein